MELLQIVHFHALYFIIWCVAGQNTSEITWPFKKIVNSEIIPLQKANNINDLSFLGKVCSKFSRDGPTPSQVVQKINMKCVEARRPPRSHATPVVQQ